MVFLEAKEKEKENDTFLDDPLACDKLEFKNWKKDNSMVRSWLWNNMEVQIAQNYMFFATTKGGFGGCT